MDENRKFHTASKNTYRFFYGFFICLLSLVLIINIGGPAHLINFPLLYLFGFGAFPILLYFYLLGNSFMFRKKGFIIKKWNHWVATVLFTLALLMLASYVTYKCGASQMVKGNAFANMMDVFKNIPGGYLTTNVINVFTINNPFGGGAIGYLLVSLLVNVNDAFCLTIIIFLFVVGYAFIFLAILKQLVKKTILHKNAKVEEVDDISSVDIDSTDDTNNNSQPLDSGIAKSIAPSPITPLDFADRQNNASMHFSNIVDCGVKFTQPEFKQKKTFHNEEMAFKPPVEPLISQPIEELNNSLNVEMPYEETVPVLENNDLPEKTEETPSIPLETVVEEAIPKPKPIVWIPPSANLLTTYPDEGVNERNRLFAEDKKAKINEIFSNFGVNASCVGFTVGPSVTRYHIEYGANVYIRQVSNMVEDISLRVGGQSARFESVIEGQTYSGLEIPNEAGTMVSFKEVFEALPDVKKHPMAVPFGKNISGQSIAADLDEFPHLLVAGTTGSGKSIYVHSIIMTLIMRMSPESLRIALIDPKKVEMMKYRDMPHLLCPIVTDAFKAKVMLSKLVAEMEDRYSKFENAESCSNIKQYNEWAKENNMPILPYIVVFADEYADLVDTCKDISQPVVSIAQKARAAGIHLVICTQRPSTNVITGVIKGNLSTRVALMTASSVDSVTIVGVGGAEKLLGKGDMLVSSPLISRVGMVRLQGCFINNKEINHVVGYLKEHYPVNYDPNFLDLVDHSKEEGRMMVDSGMIANQAEDSAEAKYQSVKEWVMCQEYMSMSKIQRECGVGFNRAGLFFKRLREEGVVDRSEEGNRGSRVLIHDKFSNIANQEVTSSEQIVNPSNDGEEF